MNLTTSQDLDLEIDYNLLESTLCISCRGEKKIGARLCQYCLSNLDAASRAKLLRVEPGEGIVDVIREVASNIGGRKRAAGA